MSSIRTALLILLLLIAPAAAQDAQKVAEVRFVGLRSLSSAYVKKQLKLVEEQPFTRDKLNEDLRRLAELGLFESVDVATEVRADGVVITYTVSEARLIADVTAVGFANLDFDGEVRPQLRLEAGKPFSDYFERLDRERVEALYRDKGYMFAHVQVNTRLDEERDPPALRVRFRVEEGPLVSLETIRFVGNATFSARQLKRVMTLQESSWPRWLFRETFDPRTLSRDLITLSRFYQQKGFLDAQVALGDLEYSPDKREMAIEIHVEEGRRFKVGKVSISGNQLFTVEELINRMKLRPGAFYDEEQLLSDQGKIRDLYGDNARIRARISVQKVTAQKEPVIDLVLKVDEGRRFHVNRVEVRGNEVTKDEVIRRQLRLYPGDPFNLFELRKSYRRLLSLDYFDSVSFTEEDSGTDGLRDLIVTVKEKASTGNVLFGVGVNSNVGVVGEISLTERNFDISRWPRGWKDVGDTAFKGAGQLFQISVQPGSEVSSGSIRFREPAVYNSDYGLDLGFRATDARKVRSRAFAERRVGGSIGLSRQLTDSMSVKLTYSLMNVSLSDIDGDAPEDVREFEGGGTLSTLGFDWGLDERDNRVLPTKGYRLGAGIAMTGVALGGDFDYFKTTLRASKYFTTHRTKDERPYVLTLSSALRNAFDAGTDVPVFSRYYLGGHGSVRGFEAFSISPREDGTVVGGTTAFLFNIEYSIPLYEETLRLVTFADFGHVDGLRASIGFGFRVKVPALGPVPLALDFGIPVRKEDEDETQIFSFSLGRGF